MVTTLNTTLGGRNLSIETGKVAQQAGGAVVVRYGDTVVLATATASVAPREGTDFFPLTIDYEERLYAIGKIPGNFFRREGRPSTGAILAARLTDRPLRPLFPKGYRNDVQVIITILSADQETDPDTIGTIAASAALTISDIPFDGPVSSVRIGFIDGGYVVNPTFAQLEKSDLDLVVASTRDAVVMVEAGAKQLSEEVVLEAIGIAHDANQSMIALQDELREQAGMPKREAELKKLDPAIRDAVAEAVADRLDELVVVAKDERSEFLYQIRQDLVARLGEQYDAKDIYAALEDVMKGAVRSAILENKKRPDGRSPVEIRPISAEVGVLPRTHGTGLFTRGQTQVLTIATLGSVGDVQRLDTLAPEATKRYMHHYNFPPFSVGEVRRIGSPGRREIGHGALAERALEPMIPPVEEFPYTIRLVSDVLSSNGSSSMASVCGSTLALMDAGVPIQAPVAGVAMGLIMGDDGRFEVLTDIAGLEDSMGDMDFKVAGTEKGITAIQMDIKIKGITPEVMQTALRQAHDGRIFILGKMAEAITTPRTELSKYAPRMYRLQIPVEKIGAVIGPGGRMIRSIIEDTKASIDIEDDGSVFIGAANEEGARKAITIIEGLTKELEPGQIYTGKVVRILPFGAFVEVLPGKDAMVHISELAEHRVNTVEDVVKLGDEIMVVITEIDDRGRVNASRRALLEDVADREAGEDGEPVAPREPRSTFSRGGSYGGGRGGQRGGNGRPPGGPRREGSFGGNRGGPGGPRRDSGPGGPPRRPGGFTG
ncbi:MAG: polyribonucleotide nucleotidyltransferase [Dehalococcoidia bacterium]